MAFTIMTLNIEEHKHLASVVALIMQEKPDVVCLQEVLAADFPQIKNKVAMEGEFFSTSHRVDKDNPKSGVCVLTSLSHSSIMAKYYLGTGHPPRVPTAYKKDCVLVLATIKHNNKEYIIGTTHFDWTPNGKPSPTQWKAFHALMEYIHDFDDFILCGDFNAPRGGEIFSAFTKYLTDNLPLEIDSTLDPVLHRVPGLHLAVDTIFSTPEYVVKKVRTIAGVSDHKAIVGEIERR